MNLHLSDLKAAMSRRRCDACGKRGRTLTPVSVYESLGPATVSFILCHRCDDMTALELLQFAVRDA